MSRHVLPPGNAHEYERPCAFRGLPHKVAEVSLQRALLPTANIAVVHKRARLDWVAVAALSGKGRGLCDRYQPHWL